MNEARESESQSADPEFEITKNKTASWPFEISEIRPSRLTVQLALLACMATISQLASVTTKLPSLGLHRVWSVAYAQDLYMSIRPPVADTAGTDESP
jgi:hypothetical protein